MRNFFISLIIIFFTSLSALAATVPNDIQAIIKKDFPKADIRFDGLITLPDGVIYLPLYPAKIVTPEKLSIKTTYPDKKALKDEPEVVIFNNDFVLLKLLENSNGQKTVKNFQNPPIEIKTGLLPQDMLVPRGFVVSDNIKGIIGGLEIATVKDHGLKVKSELLDSVVSVVSNTKGDLVANVPQLKNKLFYIITCYSKNVHVVPTDKAQPQYALSLKSAPIDIKGVGNKFLLITTFQNNTLDVISLADDAIIKHIDFESQPEEIVWDSKNKKAYISSSEKSSIYVIDTETMLLKQKIQVNGKCEKLILTSDLSKIIYVDKNTNEVWLVELNKDYEIKDIGKFPNISKIAYAQNKIYLTSRTKNKIAIVDYATLSLIEEIELCEKPVDMYLYRDYLFILSAKEAVIQVIDTRSDQITNKIIMNSKGFPTKIYRIEGSNLAVVTNAKAGNYSILNLDKKQIIKTNPMDIPINGLVITNKINKINK